MTPSMAVHPDCVPPGMAARSPVAKDHSIEKAAPATRIRERNG